MMPFTPAQNKTPLWGDAGRSASKRRRGFSLIEVLVAVALLAIGVTGLLMAQAQSMRLAQEARALTVATMLARGKLLDCETELLKRGFSIGDYKDEGKFDDEGYDDFYWECHAYQPDLPVPEAGDIQQGALAGMTGGALGGAAPGGGAPNPMADMGMGMIAPVVSQLAGIMKESVRELIVIVKWQDGQAWEELKVGTHLVDTTAVNAVAQQLGNLPGLPGLPGMGGGGAKPPAANNQRTQPTTNPFNPNTSRRR